MVQAQPRARQEIFVRLLLFVFVAAVYLSLPTAHVPTDTSWTIPTSLSLLHQGNFDLNEYPTARGDPNGVMDLNGRLISFFPLATPILITPAVALIEALLRPSLDLYTHLQRAPDWLLVARLSLQLAALIAAGTTVIVYSVLRRLHARRWAVALTLVFAFGTMMWSTASRDLWQHTFSTFFLALALYLLVAGQEDNRLIPYVALPLALAYTARPTNSLSVIAITLYVLVCHRRWILRYLACAALVAAPFIALNLAVYRSVLPPYFLSSRLSVHPAFAQALAGNLISPARGLLIYAPVMLFALVGFAMRWRRRRLSGLDWTLAAVIAGHWVVVSSFPHWWGGASYGPRFMTDMLPYLAYFMALGVLEAGTGKRPLRTAAYVAFALLAIMGIAIHYRGAADERTWAWNGVYPLVVPSVDAAPERLWDWRDAQFVRGLRGPELSVEAASLADGTLLANAGALRLTAPPGAALSEPVRVVVRNLGDQPFAWESSLARRIVRLPAEQHIGALSYAELYIQADANGLQPGCHPLGGMLIRTTPDAIWGAPVALPVVVDIHGAGEAAACESQPPTLDLLRDGAAQLEGGKVVALLGEGWYDAEASPSDVWRWTASPAHILIYSPDSRVLRIGFTPVALYEPGHGPGPQHGELRFSLGGRTDTLAVETGRALTQPLALQRGWNDLALELAAGNYRPIDLDPATGDTRSLSFALGPIHLGP